MYYCIVHGLCINRARWEESGVGLVHCVLEKDTLTGCQSHLVIYGHTHTREHTHTVVWSALQWHTVTHSETQWNPAAAWTGISIPGWHTPNKSQICLCCIVNIFVHWQESTNWSGSRLELYYQAAALCSLLVDLSGKAAPVRLLKRERVTRERLVKLDV